MVGKVTEGVFKSIHFRISILVLLLFFTAIWYVNNLIEKETIDRVNAITEDVAINNVYLVTSLLNGYEEQLRSVQSVLNTDQRSKLEAVFEQMHQRDSSICDLYVEPFNGSPADSSAVYRTYQLRKGGGTLTYSLPFYPYGKLCLTVDLMGFHQRIAGMEGLNYAYVTITCGGVYLYHPDEHKIGTSLGEQDLMNERLAASGNRFVEKIHSDYLNIPVSRYYHPQQVSGQRWVFTASMPNIGLSESFRKTGMNFFIISLLAMFSFIAVFSLGVIRWRKEFVRRQEIEQQNLNLLLKDEKRKQMMVTTELERLKSGLNPHFLFNSLSSLRVLVGLNPEVAKDFAINLSNLYRYLLKQENQNLVALDDELVFTRNYISLQKIRFDKKLQTEIIIPDDYLQRRVPPLSLQLLVENCIKHTRISDSEPLFIRIFVENDMLVVENNYSPRVSSDAENSGKGIENLIKRYSFLTDRQLHFGVINGTYVAKIPLLIME